MAELLEWNSPNEGDGTAKIVKANRIQMWFKYANSQLIWKFVHKTLALACIALIYAYFNFLLPFNIISIKYVNI